MDSIACNVRIETKTEEENRIFESFGTLFHGTEGFSVRYADGGDEVTLSCSNDGIFMERRGETGLSARFCLGETTEMRLFLGDSCGSLPVFTNLLKIAALPHQILCSLAYRLGQGEGSIDLSLKISILFSEES